MTGTAWKVLKSELVMCHPHIEVALEQVSLPDGRIIDDWPIVTARDYVNVAVFNETGEALILEGYEHGTRRSGWQVVGGYIEDGEDPLSAAQRELLEAAGHQADDWRYLGSFVVDANRHVGVGHFFLCTNARYVSAPTADDLEAARVRWVPLKDLRYALMDGRISVISYAMNITLALLALNKLDQNQALSYLLANTNNGNKP